MEQYGKYGWLYSVRDITVYGQPGLKSRPFFSLKYLNFKKLFSGETITKENVCAQILKYTMLTNGRLTRIKLAPQQHPSQYKKRKPETVGNLRYTVEQFCKAEFTIVIFIHYTSRELLIVPELGGFYLCWKVHTIQEFHLQRNFLRNPNLRVLQKSSCPKVP